MEESNELWNRPVITLTQEELERAILVGIRRQRMSVKRKEKGVANPGKHGYEMHLRGAVGELAVCKYLDVEWSASEGTYKAEADIAPDIEVRCSSLSPPDLIMRQSDYPERRYVLTSTIGLQGHDDIDRLIIWGWAWGWECLRDDFLTTYGYVNRPACWGVWGEILDPPKPF